MSNSKPNSGSFRASNPLLQGVRPAGPRKPKEARFNTDRKGLEHREARQVLVPEDAQPLTVDGMQPKRGPPDMSAWPIYQAYGSLK